MEAPNRQCWCGCGELVSRRADFLPGHDRRAEAAVVKLEYGSVTELLHKHGYGPGGKSAVEELRKYEQHGGL